MTANISTLYSFIQKNMACRYILLNYIFSCTIMAVIFFWIYVLSIQGKCKIETVIFSFAILIIFLNVRMNKGFPCVFLSPQFRWFDWHVACDFFYELCFVACQCTITGFTLVKCSRFIDIRKYVFFIKFFIANLDIKIYIYLLIYNGR